MASRLCAAPRAGLPHENYHSFVPLKPPARFAGGRRINGGKGRSLKVRVSYSGGDGESYLGMWKKAVERERKGMEFQRIAENPVRSDSGDGNKEEEEEEVEESEEVIQRKSEEFKKILEVSTEERDRIQKMQVIDRAAAAIAAARAVLSERKSFSASDSGDSGSSQAETPDSESRGSEEAQDEGKKSESSFGSYSGSSRNGAPGPDFWSWTPPDVNSNSDAVNSLKSAEKTSPYPNTTSPVMEKEQSLGYLSIPFESQLSQSNRSYPVPPLQSSTESEKVDVANSSVETASLEEERELGVLFSGQAAEVAHALNSVDEVLDSGTQSDGSRWWKEMGVETRPDGVICRWTLIRGVSADKAFEWEEKFWEAADQFDYKELGSEKSGRDASGNVWREFWRESMRQESGYVHFEKTADKWGKNGKGDEWQEKWWEHYDSSGKAEKWADKWCSIDRNTLVEAGHAHVWHERWGETYDGQGGSTKYTDKWAEQFEGDGWAKWGDKWDENFDPNGHGVKQGEKWWRGKHGEQWNRTWGERHNGSGWVHKYGKSSSGEHWDTHVKQDTWYERFPHFGFWHCFENSVQLRQVKKPSET